MSEAQIDKPFPLYKLPTEILVEIFSNMDYLELHLGIKPICRLFRSIIDKSLHGSLGENLHRSTSCKAPPLSSSTQLRPPSPPRPQITEVSDVDGPSIHSRTSTTTTQNDSNLQIRKVFSLPPDSVYHPVLRNLGFIFNRNHHHYLEFDTSTTTTTSTDNDTILTETLIRPSIGIISDRRVPHTEEKYTARYLHLLNTPLFNENATNPPRERVYLYRLSNRFHFGFPSLQLVYYRYTIRNNTPGKPVTVGDVAGILFGPVVFNKFDCGSRVLVEKVKPEFVGASVEMLKGYIWRTGLEVRVDCWIKYGEEGNRRCYYDDDVGSCWIVADPPPQYMTTSS